MIDLNKESGVLLYVQIRDQFRELILSNYLKSNFKLPSTRKLAKKIRVNRNTILNAYAELEAEGLIYSLSGKGVFVSENDRLRSPAIPNYKIFNKMEHSQLKQSSRASEQAEVINSPARLPDIAFVPANPGEDLFPSILIKKCFSAVMKDLGNSIFQACDPEGYRPLREFLAKMLATTGIRVFPQNICVVNGAQHALSLIARILIRKGDRVAVEVPSFPGILAVLRNRKADVIGIPVDKDGMNIDIFEENLKKKHLKAVFITPNFHNPTGATMSLIKRLKVIELAEKYEIRVIEDDAFGDLRIEGEDLPSLKSLDRTGQIIYIKSLSSILPSFRMGWMIVDDFLRDQIVSLRRIEDLRTNTLTQALLYKFYSRGYYRSHLNKIRKAYKERRDAMLGSLRRHFPKGYNFLKPQGGAFLWIKYPDGTDLTAVFEKSLNMGIVLDPGCLFYGSPKGKNEIRLCYSSNPPNKIDDGIRILGRIISETL